jgi:glycosyltransferase involved in cell wall biosynthesis
MKVLLFANTDWYLYNFRLALAKAIRNTGHEVVCVSPPGNYGKHLESEGFRWINLRMNRRSLNPWSEFQVLMALTSLYRHESPDIVHHFTIKCVIYGSIAARMTGVLARVNAVAGLGYVFTNNGLCARMLRPLVKAILRLAVCGKRAKLILQNPDDVKEFLDYGLITTEQVRLIRSSGVNTKRFRPVDQQKSDGIRVLLATRLLWDKGIMEYMEAARILKQKDKSIDFLLAGAPDSGNPASVSENDVLKWREEGTVIPLGHVENMEHLLSTVDLVALPTYREGTPRILLEAAAMGLPIVATDVPGCREIVSHGENGLLVPPKDSVALAKAIKLLADDPDKRHQMGKVGRKKVLAEFDESIVIEETLSVYKELLPEFEV